MSEQISELERRRLAARAHDQEQRDAEATAERLRTEPLPSKELPTPPVRVNQTHEDRLAVLLVQDGRALVTVADLRLIFEYFSAEIEGLEALLDQNEDA